VVFHIPIPVEDNSAGKPLRGAVSESTGGTSQVPWIDAGELAQLGNGELYEHSETVGFLAADSNVQKQAKIDARFTALSTSVLNRARATLKFWGLNRNLP
jgi:hypothetical protein